MSQNRPIEFANFVCKFDVKNMLDYVQEIVIPAFTVESRIRKYGTSHFFLLNVELFAFTPGQGDPLGIICGRFIKDTTLSREQYWDQSRRKIVKDKKSIEAAPSSIFALILNNHKLAYLSETAYAPTLAMFESTMRSFLAKSHAEYLTRLHRTHPEVEVPVPILEITPLPSQESVNEFLKRFVVLKHAEFEVALTNNNLEGEDFFREQRSRARKIKSSKAKISYDNPKGLDKDEAAAQIAQASSEGVNKIKIRGTDRQGDTLTGTNDEIKVRAELPIEPGAENLKPVAQEMATKFGHLSQQGALKVKSATRAENTLVRNMLNALGLLGRSNRT